MGEVFDIFGGLSTLSPGSWAAIVMVLGAAGIWWIRGMPDRRRADNEATLLKINEAEAIRTDYAKQIQEFRLEVHGYRNEMAKLQADLTTARHMSMRRADQLNMVFFILRLVMNELRRLDPDSETLAQAEGLLALVSHPEDGNNEGSKGRGK